MVKPDVDCTARAFQIATVTASPSGIDHEPIA